MQKRNIRLLCGYTGTGKDELGLYLNTGKRHHSWVVYRHPGSNVEFPQGPGIRLASADAVKREVKAELGLGANFDIEKQKNEIVKAGRTFRSYCIEKGCGMRKKDPSHWIRLVFDQIGQYSLPGYYTVTDFRFIEEYEYALTQGNVTTLRVFRHSVPIPLVVNPQDDPEHSLDTFTTDFLVVPRNNHDKEFEAAIKIFPQYQDFVYCDNLLDAKN